MRTIEDVLNRLRAEFAEMPGIGLTAEQVQRLCGVDRTICQMVLDVLVNENFLAVKSNRQYARRTDGEVCRPRLAKADRTVEIPRLPKAS